MSVKVAVVTGAARGLGRGFAEALLKKGYKVYFCDIDAKQGEKTQNELAIGNTIGQQNISFHKCDVTIEKDFKDFLDGILKNHQTIDVFINNAGIFDEFNWKRSVDINLNALITGTYMAIESMKKCNGGRGGFILNVASIAGLYSFPPGPVYCATKHAVIGFTRSLAELPDVRSNGIRLACICPNFADTDIINNREDKTKYSKIIDDMIRDLGIMKVSRVKEAFVDLLEDKDNNGKAKAIFNDSDFYFQFQEIGK